MEHIGGSGSSGTEPAYVDATHNNNSDSIELLSALPTQITSIDGFFNRKRGRPPKNRFVEVYKSAQHSPQAIFTSFKLEKNDQSVSGTSSTEATDERIPLRLGAATMQPLTVPTATASATDLTPSRNSRKRARVWNMDSQRSLANVTNISSPSGESTKNASMVDLTERSSPISLILPSPCLQASSSKSLERVSVVRAAGTFYPENASSAPAAVEQSTSISLVSDQPEDLSMRAVQQQKQKPMEPESEPEPEAATATETETETSAKLMQFKQLLDLYQRQVLLPSFLAAGQLDMRLLLEQAAQQKMLLINAAAAAAVAATTAATATTTSALVEATPKPNTNPTPAPSRTGVKRSRDLDIPLGYLKFRFNEDCNFERCGYRNHQSHFHCNRRDCHYSFCDKTRFVQHTARHERMDALMGDDFRQYRANMRCEVRSCPYATKASTSTQMAIEAPKKSSHFHCRKCDYVCTDSNKVVAHRRLHMRLDYVRSAGFRKIASNESCDSATCTYALRHTHYHCTTCDGSVLSRAQLASHRHRSTSSWNSNQSGAESATSSSCGLSLVCSKQQ